MKRVNLKASMTAVLLLTVTLTGQMEVANATDWRKGAEGREVDCLLQVKGKTYLKGTCKYNADQDGSFRLFGDKYFVYLNTLENGLAGASWNETLDSSHAHSLLGEDFKRQGACWIGKNAKICAWDKKDAQANNTKPTRIKFARGATSVKVTGKLANFESEQRYVIEVGKGQSMSIEQVNPADKRVTLGITAPNGEDASDMDLSCNNKKTVSPTQAGDYTITVHECMKADPWKGSYTLKVTVTTPKTTN